LPCCHVHLRGPKPLPPGYPRELRNLGDHLRKRRLDLELLQRQATEQIGVERSTVTNWELSRTAPDLRRLPNIMRFLGYDPTPQAETLAAALKQYRRQQGMSQKELAGRLRVDPSTLARWELERRKPAGRLVVAAENFLFVVGAGSVGRAALGVKSKNDSENPCSNPRPLASS
jgi:transcriptional regulator with XRE-family HTH domain